MVQLRELAMKTLQSITDWFKSLSWEITKRTTVTAICRSRRRGRNTSTGTYLYKDHTTNSFQDQHNCHGQCIDASIVMHVRVIFHTVAYDSLISQSHSGVLQKIQDFRGWLRQGWSMYTLHVAEFNCLVPSSTVFDISSLKYFSDHWILQKLSPGRDAWLVDL